MRVLIVSKAVDVQAIDGLDAVVSESLADHQVNAFDAVVLDLDGVGSAALQGIAGQTVCLAITSDAAGATAALERGCVPLDRSWVELDPQLLVREIERRITMARRLRELEHLRERQAQLVQNEKFAAVGLLAAEIAHEINNPATFVITNLTVMIDYVQTITRFHNSLRELLEAGGTVDGDELSSLEEQHEIGFLGEDLDTLVRRSLTGLHRIHQIVQDLRYFSSDRRTETNWVDIDGLVNAALNLVRHEARFRAKIVVEFPHLPPVRSDANRLSQVILNLLVNAVQSIEAGAPDENVVTVTARVEPDEIVLVIEDTGSGMSPEVLERVFDPFFTTKAAGSGTGLGLSISRDIMLSLGGEIRASSELGVGSRFEVAVPRGGDDDDE